MFKVPPKPEFQTNKLVIGAVLTIPKNEGLELLVINAWYCAFEVVLRLLGDDTNSTHGFAKLPAPITIAIAYVFAGSETSIEEPVPEIVCVTWVPETFKESRAVLLYP